MKATVNTTFIAYTRLIKVGCAWERQAALRELDVFFLGDIIFRTWPRFSGWWYPVSENLMRMHQISLQEGMTDKWRMLVAPVSRCMACSMSGCRRISWLWQSWLCLGQTARRQFGHRSPVQVCPLLPLSRQQKNSKIKSPVNQCDQIDRFSVIY